MMGSVLWKIYAYMLVVVGQYAKTGGNNNEIKKKYSNECMWTGNGNNSKTKQQKK